MDSCPPIMSRAGSAGMTEGCGNDGRVREGRLGVWMPAGRETDAIDATWIASIAIP